MKFRQRTDKLATYHSFYIKINGLYKYVEYKLSGAGFCSLVDADIQKDSNYVDLNIKKHIKRYLIIKFRLL